MFDALARLADRHRRLVLIVAGVFVLFAAAYGGPVVSLLNSDDDFEDHQSESVLARADVERATGQSAAPDMVVLVRLGAPADSAQAQQKIARVAGELRDPGVADVIAYRTGGPRELVSRDGRSTYLLATFHSGLDDDKLAEKLQDRVEREPGVTAGGGQLAFAQVSEQVQADLTKAEMLAFPLLFLLSLVVFRSAVAALLPVIVGGTTILATFVWLRLVNTVEPMSVFAINLITGAGLGLAIDYSLFVVSRFREELATGATRGAVLQATMRTAGRTVLFSAVTVAAAMASLIVFHLRFLYSMAYGGALVALTAALVSLTVLPALLAALGPRVNALSLKRWQVAINRDAEHVRSGGWYRFSQLVMRRPAPIAIIAATVLIVLGLPFLRVAFTGVDADVLPREKSARVVSDAINTEFPPGRTTPIYAVAQTGDAAAVRAYAERLGEVPGVAAAPEPVRAGDLWRIDVVGKAHGLSDESKQLVRDVRAVPAPFPHRVGGGAAAFLDQQESLRGVAPTRARAALLDDACDPVRDDRLGRAPGQGAADEPAHAQRRLRPARADLPGRPARGRARLPLARRARIDAADPAVRDRVRALDRLRRVPAHPDQGGARLRHAGSRGGGDRARAHGPHRHVRRAVVLCGHRCVRDIPGGVHQGARRRDGARRADRRVHRADVPGPVADGPARALELVGAAPARPTARPSAAG